MSSEEIKLSVSGTPVGQPRARTTRRGFSTRFFHDENHPAMVFRKWLGLLARQYFAVPWTGPVEVSIVAVFPRPKKHRPQSAVPMTGRPDCDNIEKAVLDGLNKIAFRDDAQVFRLSSEKWIGAVGEAPRTDITIRRTLDETQGKENPPAKARAVRNPRRRQE